MKDPVQPLDQSSTTYFIVDWHQPTEGNATSYRVHVTDIPQTCPNGTHHVTNITDFVKVTNYNATGLEPGRKFSITIRARVNDSQEGEPVTILGYTSK